MNGGSAPGREPGTEGRTNLLIGLRIEQITLEGGPRDGERRVLITVTDGERDLGAAALPAAVARSVSADLAVAAKWIEEGLPS